MQDNNIQPDVVEYLKTPLTKSELTHLVKLLAITVRDLTRKTETEYKEMNLSDQSLTDDALLTAISEAPKLMQRPVVVNGTKAAIGRPPENVLEII